MKQTRKLELYETNETDKKTEYQETVPARSLTPDNRFSICTNEFP